MATIVRPIFRTWRKPSSSSSYTEFSKGIPLLLFFIVCVSVISYVAFHLYLFVHQLSPSFGTSAGLCTLIVASPGYITKTRLFKYIENFTSKNWEFSDKKNSDIFHTSDQNIDCGNSLKPPRRGDSNEYQQSMFLIRNKKNTVYPCEPSFTI